MCYQQVSLKLPSGRRFLPLRNVYENSSQGEKLWVADGGVPITATHGAETGEWNYRMAMRRARMAMM
jgi:hypothetical protein